MGLSCNMLRGYVKLMMRTNCFSIDDKRDISSFRHVPQSANRSGACESECLAQLVHF